MEDEMVGWHRPLDRHEFEQVLGDNEGQGSLACCSPWGHKESDTTERLNNKFFVRNEILTPITMHGFFLHDQAILRHQLDVLKVNSILTLLT